MPKCQKVLEKSKRKGQECGIYTNKQINGVYYCSSHIKVVPNNNTENNVNNTVNDNTPIKSEKPNDNEYIKRFIVDLNTGYSLDEVVDFKYNELKNNMKDNKKREFHKGMYNEFKDKISQMYQRLNDIEEQINNSIDKKI